MTDFRLITLCQSKCSMTWRDTGQNIPVCAAIIPPAEFGCNRRPTVLPLQILCFPHRIRPVQTVIRDNGDQCRMEFEVFRCKRGMIICKNTEFGIRIFLCDSFRDPVTELQIQYGTVFGTKQHGFIRNRIKLFTVFTFTEPVSIGLPQTPGTQIGILCKGIANHPDGFPDDCRIGHTRLPVDSVPRWFRDITFAVDYRVKFGIGLPIFCHRKHVVKIVSDGKTVGIASAQ